MKKIPYKWHLIYVLFVVLINALPFVVVTGIAFRYVGIAIQSIFFKIALYIFLLHWTRVSGWIFIYTMLFYVAQSVVYIVEYSSDLGVQGYLRIAFLIYCVCILPHFVKTALTKRTDVEPLLGYTPEPKDQDKRDG